MNFISICGGTGSGKSTISNILTNQNIKNNLCISQDSYYNANHGLTYEEKQAINYAHPDEFDIDLFQYQLRQLRDGKSILMPKYCFETSERLEEKVLVMPKKNVLIDGLFPHHYKGIDEILNQRIFVDVSAMERLRRNILRDTKERGRTKEWVIYQFERDTTPLHDKYIEPLKETSNLIVDGSLPTENCVYLINKHLEENGIYLSR